MKLIACVSVLFTILGVAATARAGEAIVLESYTGAKPERANDVLAPVLEELSKRGFVAGYESVGRKFEARGSRPAVIAGLPADFAAQVEAGHRAWISGKFEDAVKILSPLVELAHANTGAFVKNQALREKVLRALAALALSQQRLGDPSAARATFAEIARSFPPPDVGLARATYGAEAVSQFEQVKKDLATAGRGKLVVKVDADNAVVFVNERFESVGGWTKDMLPGEYRVFAGLDKQLSRAHRVTVKANDVTTLTIDGAFDVVVQTSPKLTGLVFANAADRERNEAAFAKEFANAIDARGVAIVGIDQVRGRPAVIGVLVNLVNGRELRRASIALEPEPSADRLRALARFLAGEEVTGIDVEVAGDVGVAPRLGGGGDPTPETPGEGGLWGGWKYVTGGAALVSLGIGGVLLVTDGNCSNEPPPGMVCADVYRHATPGWIAVGGGVALCALTVYLAMRGDAEPARSAAIVPTSGGAMATFRMAF